MAFKNIDAPGEGNRRARRAVAVIQRKSGADGRLGAAQAKRQRKMARSFEKNIGKTIVFYAMPPFGVTIQEPDGAYLCSHEVEERRQIVVAGPLKVSIDHYVNAIGLFLRTKMRLVSDSELQPAETVISARPFTSIIVEPVK